MRGFTRVYVLNSGFECVGQTRLDRALTLSGRCRHCGEPLASLKNCTDGHGMHQPKAEVVKNTDKTVRTSRGPFAIPMIIRVFEHIPLYSRKVKFSNQMVWERDHYTCRYCGVKITTKKMLETDHVFPRSRGGKTCFENMVTACSTCNARKKNRTPQEAGMKLLGPLPLGAPTLGGAMRKINLEVQRILREEIALA